LIRDLRATDDEPIDLAAQVTNHAMVIINRDRSVVRFASLIETGFARVRLKPQRESF
jgi:hypothetical protein